MKNLKFWRTALVATLVLTVMLSVTGGTIAWFTDEVVSETNTISAGNLDIEVSYMNDDTNTWEKLQDSKTVFAQNKLWEPGRTEVIYLKVENKGSLSLKYKANVHPSDTEIGAVNVEGNEFLLSDYITFGMTTPSTELVKYTKREDAKTDIAYETGELGLKEDLFTAEVPCLKPGATEYLALVVYMPETVGNEANYRPVEGFMDPPRVDLFINVYAAQAMDEADSFGHDYDAGATYLISNGEDLLTSLDEINDLKENVVATLKLTDDVQYTGKTLEIMDSNVITFDLNGNDMNIVNSESDKDAIVVGEGATLNLVNTGSAATLEIKADDEKSAITVADGGTLNVEATVNLPGNDNTILAESSDSTKPATVNIKDGATLSTAAEENAVLTLGANAVGNMSGGVINAVYPEENADWANVKGIQIDADSAVFNMSGGTINVGGKHCASGIRSYRKACTINITGGTINVSGDTTGGVGENIGIELGRFGTLNISNATINVQGKNDAAGIGIYPAKDTIVNMAGSVRINVTNYADYSNNFAIRNSDMDFTNEFDPDKYADQTTTAAFKVDGVLLTADNDTTIFENIVKVSVE